MQLSENFANATRVHNEVFSRPSNSAVAWVSAANITQAVASPYTANES
jgi:hypothetical protein